MYAYILRMYTQTVDTWLELGVRVHGANPLTALTMNSDDSY